jgi:hypothetical protein
VTNSSSKSILNLITCFSCLYGSFIYSYSLSSLVESVSESIQNIHLFVLVCGLTSNISRSLTVIGCCVNGGNTFLLYLFNTV